MRTLILGPTFTLQVNESTQALTQRLEHWLDHGCPYEAMNAGTHFQLAIPPNDRHRWSPWLTLEIIKANHKDNHEAENDQATTIQGRFNPSPAIWTAYMLATLAWITLALGAAIWASAQFMLKQPPSALWVSAACMLALVIMWLASAAGQRLAHTEMIEMRRAIEQAVGLPAAT